MTVDQMYGLFWELVGLTSSYTRAMGSGTPAGPNLAQVIHQSFLEMVRYARPQSCRKYGTLTLVASTERYALPTDWLDWYDAEDEITIAGLPIEQKLRGEVEKWRDGELLPSTSDTCFWYEAGSDDDGASGTFGRKLIGFYPVPTTAGTAKIHYLRKPVLLTASGMSGSVEYPDIPADFHEAAVYLAVWKFYQRRKELPTKPIEFLLQYYQSKLPELKRATAERLRPNFRSSTPNCLSGLICAADPID